MNKRLFVPTFILIVLAFFFSGCVKQSIQTTPDSSLNISTMQIKSSAFDHNAPIPSKYTCDGENISPPLTISDIPENTVSLAIIADDPDAPGGTWVHWVVWNIDPETSEIEEGQVPLHAIEGYTSFESNGYGGPCPPSGTHRYFFKVYALDTMLKLHPNSNKTILETAMKKHILDETRLIGTYSRS